MGKTTLCKKIIHDFLHKDLWQDLYDRVFWLPLRRLRLIGDEAKSVAQMIQEVCFHGVDDGLLPAKLLRDTLEDSISRCLFVLDGLDEVSYAIDHDSPMGANLYKLLTQENVIITSRPHSTGVLKRSQPDIEFETIGFFPQQVEEFLYGEADQDESCRITMSAIRDFIKRRPVVQSLVRIPVQLDAICYAWNSEHFQQSDMTMTMVYQAISNRLWQKDIVRLGRKFDGNHITSQQIQNCTNVRHFMEPEISCLEELAFAGLYSQLVEFTSMDINNLAKGQVPLLDSRLSKLSFLRSSGNLVQSLDQTTHFIHLTFQEYFAAHYFIRHWSSGKAMVFPKMILRTKRRRNDLETVTPVSFLQTEKYNARYDIFWHFVTGLLQTELGDEALNQFFKELEAEPHHFLGIVHQRLLIACLNEVVNDQGSFQPKKQELEHNYQQWIVYESYHGTQSLLRNADCPISALLHCLRKSNDDKKQILMILARRTSIPPEALEAAIEEAEKNSDPYVQQHALAVVARHCDQLPEDKFTVLSAAYPIDVWSRACKLTDGEGTGQLLIQHFAQMLSNEPRNENPHVTCSVIQALGHWRSLPKSITEVLVRHLQDQDPDIRSEAAQALEVQSSLSDSVVEALVRLAQDRSQDFHVLQGATRALGGQSCLPESAVEALAQLLQDQNPSVRSRAARALAEQSSLPVLAIETMVRLLQDQDFDVRFHAAAALEGRASLPGSAVDALVRLLQEESSDIQYQAAKALEDQISLSESAVENLARILENPDPNIRCNAASIFGGRGILPKPAIAPLVRLLEDENPEVRYYAIHALSVQRDLPESTVEILIRLLQDQAGSVQGVAVIALRGQISISESAIQTLIRLLDDQRFVVRSAAARVLGTQKNLSNFAIESLIRNL